MLGGVLLALLSPPALAVAVPNPEPVAANDNRAAAGEIESGVLHLHLRAARGEWRPDDDSGRPLQVEAFGELGRPLQVPLSFRGAADTQLSGALVVDAQRVCRSRNAFSSLPNGPG
jgi:hypothetical protein